MGLFSLPLTSSKPIAFILLNVLCYARVFHKWSMEAETKSDVRDISLVILSGLH